MTQACTERLRLEVNGWLDFRIRLANHAKVKYLRRCMDVELTIYGVSCKQFLPKEFKSHVISAWGSLHMDLGESVDINCHIMPAGLGAYPLGLGRPWLRQVGAIQNWRKGVTIVHIKRGKAMQLNMQSRQELEEDVEELVSERTKSETEEESTNF